MERRSPNGPVVDDDGASAVAARRIAGRAGSGRPANTGVQIPAPPWPTGPTTPIARVLRQCFSSSLPLDPNPQHVVCLKYVELAGSERSRQVPEAPAWGSRTNAVMSRGKARTEPSPARPPSVHLPRRIGTGPRLEVGCSGSLCPVAPHRGIARGWPVILGGEEGGTRGGLVGRRWRRESLPLTLTSVRAGSTNQMAKLARILALEARGRESRDGVGRLFSQHATKGTHTRRSEETTGTAV